MRRVIGAITDWHLVESGIFAFPSEGVRTIEFDVAGSGPCLVLLHREGHAPFPLGLGDWIECKVTVPGDSEVSVTPLESAPSADGEIQPAVAYVRTRAPQQVVVSHAESFTSIEPRVRAVSDEVSQMMRLQSLNMRWRMQQQEAEFDRRLAELKNAGAAASAAVTAPAPAATPSAASASDGTVVE